MVAQNAPLEKLERRFKQKNGGCKHTKTIVQSNSTLFNKGEYSDSVMAYIGS